MRHFPRFKNGRYRFLTTTYGGVPPHASQHQPGVRAEISQTPRVGSGDRDDQRPRLLPRPHGTKASQLEHDRIVLEWLASGRSPLFGVQSETLTIVELLAAYVPFAKRYYGKGRRGEYANMKRAMKSFLDLT